jgi:hypothetical protein
MVSHRFKLNFGNRNSVRLAGNNYLKTRISAYQAASVCRL